MDMLSMGIQIAHSQAVRDEEAYQELSAKRVEKQKDLVWNLTAKPTIILGGFGIVYALVRLGIHLRGLVPWDVIPPSMVLPAVGIILYWLVITAVGVFHLVNTVGACLCSKDPYDPWLYDRASWEKFRNKPKKVEKFRNKPKKVDKYKELKASREKRLADIALYERYNSDPDFRRAYHEVMEG